MAEIVDQNEQINNRLAEETPIQMIEFGTEKSIPAITMENPNPVSKATKKRTPKQVPVLTDADTVIQSLSNMIEVVKYVKAVVCPEITETSAKVTRDLMVEFRKEIEQVKSKYISQIQKL